MTITHVIAKTADRADAESVENAARYLLEAKKRRLIGRGIFPGVADESVRHVLVPMLIIPEVH